MATGVKPPDEESKLTRADLEVIQDAMKNKKFRELLGEYCEEIRDPANQAVYQKEMTQLEKERGYDVTFINPKGGYVIKTSVAGDRKAFINICSNENVEKPSCKVQEENGQKGMSWQIPYSIIPPREDYNSKKERCVIYDVVFHPDTLRMGQVNKRFRDLVNKTAIDGLQKTYNIHLDENNIRFPKSYYKGMSVPAVIRKEDPDFKPPEGDENEIKEPDVLDKLYPQHMYPQQDNDKPSESSEIQTNQAKRKSKNIHFTHTSNHGYTIPKYTIKQQKNVDFQDYTYSKDSKQFSAIPSQIVVEINLPLLSSTKDCVLDVKDKHLSLTSENPAKYKLDIQLPYPVDDEKGNAKFDKTKHLLIVTLPVIKRTLHMTNKSAKLDSGVDSEEFSGSHSEEEIKEYLIEELNSAKIRAAPSEVQNNSAHEEQFLLPSIGYTLPSYTFNVLDDVVAFTFHVKNTDPASVQVKSISNMIQIKFSSVGSGFVPVHYAAIISFSEGIKFNDAFGEAWDNNVILQLEVVENVPTEFAIGLSMENMKKEYFDVSMIRTTVKTEASENLPKIPEENVVPVVEVTNLGTETNILVSTPNLQDSHESKESGDMKETELPWTDQDNCEKGTKSIMCKPIPMMRSYSESSYGDIASSMDYISSDCIPEESSLKKTVRFNDVIARQFYRYNSSIESQKRKNQRRKLKKRNQERRKSESEAEGDMPSSVQSSKPRIKSVLKQRRDSGVVSDAELESKNSISDLDAIYNSANDTDENGNENNPSANIQDRRQEKKDDNLSNNNSHRNSKTVEASRKLKRDAITCQNIKHNTNMYNPEKLNKGQYSEIKFKNDLIFDLDM